MKEMTDLMRLKEISFNFAKAAEEYTPYSPSIFNNLGIFQTLDQMHTGPTYLLCSAKGGLDAQSNLDQRVCKVQP